MTVVTNGTLSGKNGKLNTSEPLETDSYFDESDDDTHKVHCKGESHSSSQCLENTRFYMQISSKTRSEKTIIYCGGNKVFVRNRETFSWYREIGVSAVETCGGISNTYGEENGTFNIGFNGHDS